MKNKANNNGNGNGHNGNGFTATVEAVETNGNGNGVKAVEAEKPANPVGTSGEVKRATIVPRFDQLTPKGVEMLKNMGDIENAKLWADDFAIGAGCDTVEIGGLMMLLEAIKEKCEAEDKMDAPEDFINFIQFRLFSWTHEFEASSDAFMKSVKSGNFIVEELINSDTEEIEENVDFRTRGTAEPVEEFPSLIEEDESEDAAEETDDFSDRLRQHHLSILANKIHHVLTSDKVSQGAKAAIQHIIFNSANEANLAIDDADLVKVSVPVLINSLDLQYGRGVVHSLNALLENNLPEEVGDELRQYEGRLEPLTETKPDGDSDSLARHLSAVLKHPDTPAGIYNLLSDELGGGSGAAGDILRDTVESPAYIRQVLINLTQEDEKTAA